MAVAGLVTVNAYGAEVKADEVTTPAAEATTVATATDHATSQLTSTTVTEGNKTVTTTYVESPELEKAKATARNRERLRCKGQYRTRIHECNPFVAVRAQLLNPLI